MPEWLIIGLVLWFVFSDGGRRRRRWRRRMLREYGDDWLYVGDGRGTGRWGDGWRRGSLPGERAEGGPTSTARSGGHAPPPVPRQETAEERLRREFVEGRLTMEEYESRLWQELKPRTPRE